MSLLDHSQKRAPSPRRRSSLALLCEFGGCRRRARLAAPVSHSAPMDQANLRQIPELAKRFDVLAGFVGSHHGHHRVSGRNCTGSVFD